MMVEICSKPARPKVARGNHGQSLSEFVHKVFIPLEACDTSDTYRSQCRRAARAFSDFLGRPAELADLSPDTVKRFAAWLPGQVPENQVQMLTNRLRCVWRYVASIGMSAAINEPKRLVVERIKRKAKKVLKPKPEKARSELIPGTLAHYFETVYLPQRLVGADKIAIAEYRRKIMRFDRFVGRAVIVSELSDSFVALFLNDRVDAGLRRSTVNGYRSHLLAIWRLAAEQGLVEKGPSIRKLREAHDAPDSWTEDEFRTILSKCDRLDDRAKIGGLLPSVLMRAVLLLAYWTGLRRGTLWKLNWSDIDVANRWVTVPGEAMKGRHGKRLRIGNDAVTAIEAARIEGSVTVLPQIRWHKFYDLFSALLEASGIQPSRRLRMTKLHKVRRTTATMVAMRQGIGAASTLLGHSDQQVTLRHIDPTQMAGQDMTNILPTLSSGKGGAK